MYTGEGENATKMSVLGSFRRTTGEARTKTGPRGAARAGSRLDTVAALLGVGSSIRVPAPCVRVGVEVVKRRLQGRGDRPD